MRFYLLSFLLLPLTLLAQPKDNSPYSRFGIGDPLPQYFGNQTAMGGISAGFADGYHLNPVNPASYATLRATAFEVGFNVESSKLTRGDLSERVYNGDLNYLAIGFPIRNPNNAIFDGKEKAVKWGMMLGLSRNSRVGYDVQTGQFAIGPDTLVASYQGEGGTYRFTWGNAIKFKNLSIGLNIGSLFGRIQYERNLQFLDDPYYFNNRFEADQSLTGFLWNAGVQYKIPLKYKENGSVQRHLTVGVYGNDTQGFRTNSTQIFEAVNLGYGSERDTSFFQEEIMGDGQLPAQFGIGLMYEDINRLRLGADVQLTQWSGYENDTRPETLENGYRLSVGGEYVARGNRLKTPEQQIRYRFGGYYQKDGRTVAGTQLTDFGISLGTGFPVVSQRSAAHINLALEVGQFGIEESIRENYIRLTVGIALNDNSWFLNRKFN